ncbi:GMC family oxidoreductase [Aquisediminimonas profunda]|uniref:GMC family oxidoreductase n=1 Tax=Aquisediminimonas profunda TaxID=1550733 RepID=UPI001C6297FC|nr:GMC family oxidoreductase N-terminal domain-containing protein [Aquisediminimonas profunda]
MGQFDYIIVGAGSAGCVLANRLSANPETRVLLIEDGGTNQHPFIKMAGGFVKIMGNPAYFRAYPVAKQPGRRSEMHAYGRGLGGSSAINGTWYLPGMPSDYDNWAAQGLTGWGWDEISRCVAKFEDYRAPGAHAGRGRGGEQQITPSDYAGPVFDALMSAFEQVGMPQVPDITAPGITGVGRSQYTVDRMGQRQSTYEAFVKPVRNRPNLTILNPAAVKRIKFEGGRASGVSCERNGQEEVHNAGEVIISAGVYGSPQLLQLSGIGPGAAVQGLGIGIVHDLPAVGQNFADHQKLGVSFDLRNHPGTNREFIGWRLYRNALRYFLTRSGPLARVGMPLTGLISTEGLTSWPEFQVAAAPFAMRTINEMAENPGSPLTPRPGLTFSGYHLRPRSRGMVTVTSPDFRISPEVDPKMWSDPYDQQKALELFHLFRKLATMPALEQFIGSERMPGAQVTDEALLVEEVRKLTECGLHGTGTCSMGTDPMTSVTDKRCRVHGVEGLRVVDCSIMPTPVSGNTNGPAIAVAERAAELILEDARR